MQFEVDRNDIHRTRVVHEPVRELTSGEARLTIDAFALTSNNITYAAMGDMLQYWNFFPAEPSDDDTSWGRVPVWGFATVVESNVAALKLGQRVYGYLPMGTELVVEGGRVNATGFSDTAAHRQAMAAAYNRYVFVDADAKYDAGREEQQMVLWPLFMTSFLIDDYIADNDDFDASVVLVSSASSKTAIGAAFQLSQRDGLRVIGLTSAANRSFVGSLGCYDDTVLYDEVADLDVLDAVYVDIAGNRDVQAAVHNHFGDHLHHSMIVGNTHWDHTTDVPAPSAGPRPSFFFAPSQIAKRNAEWGAEAFDERASAAWNRYSHWTDGWLHYETFEAAPGIESAYRTLLDGHADPSTGYVVTPARDGSGGSA